MQLKIREYLCSVEESIGVETPYIDCIIDIIDTMDIRYIRQCSNLEDMAEVDEEITMIYLNEVGWLYAVISFKEAVKLKPKKTNIGFYDNKRSPEN